MPSCSYQLPIVEPAQVSSNHCPVYPHLLHFTAEEIAATPGIDRETFPDMDFTESLSDSHSSVSSSKSSSHWQQKSEMGEPKELQPAAICPEPVKANQYSRVGKGPSKSSKQNDQPTASRRKRRQPSPEATCSPNTLSMSNTAEANESRWVSIFTNPCVAALHPKSIILHQTLKHKFLWFILTFPRGCLTYRTPNFSQVAPRVCFPKGGYKPPKSKHSGKRESLFHEPPSKFKSPADIVKEVLLYATDDPMGYNRPSTSALNSTALQEFKSCQEAITLVEQLQVPLYHLLLIKAQTSAGNTQFHFVVDIALRNIFQPCQSTTTVRILFQWVRGACASANNTFPAHLLCILFCRCKFNSRRTYDNWSSVLQIFSETSFQWIEQTSSQTFFSFLSSLTLTYGCPGCEQMKRNPARNIQGKISMYPV